MTRVLFLVGLYMLVIVSAQAQYKKGVKYLDKQDFEAAKTAFEADVENKDTKPLAEYGLAILFFNQKYEEYNPEKAHDYIVQSQKSMRKVNSKVRNKIQKQGVSYGVLRKLQSNITNAYFDQVMEANQVAQLNTFLEKCEKASKPQVEKATKARNQKAFANAEAKGTFAAHKDFVGNYLKSCQKFNPTLATKAEKRLFESYISEKSWAMYYTFVEEFPNNIYVQDSAGALAMMKIVRKNSLAPFKQFHMGYPNSPFMKYAKDNMYEIIVQKKDLEEYDYFLRNFSDYEKSESLWLEFYAMYIKEQGAKGVVEFIENYPEYPDLAQLQKDLKAYEKTIEIPDYERTVKSEESDDFQWFLERYPESEFLPKLENPMAKVLKKDPSFKGAKLFLSKYPKSEHRQEILDVLYNLYAQDGEVSSLDRFYQEYPDFANEQQIEKDFEIAKKGWALDLRKPYTNEQKSAYETFIREAAPKELAFVALQRMIEDAVKNKKWTDALKTVNRYASWFGENHPKIENLKELLQAKEKGIQSNCLGGEINTETEEYVPIISVDNQYLYFCRWDVNNENIYVAEWDGNQWGEAQGIDELNTPTRNEGPMAVSADNSELIIFVEGDLYYSQKTAEGWQAPEAYPEPVNSSSWDADAMLSSDGQAMIFVSRRKDVLHLNHEAWQTYHGDGYGNIDIFVSLKDDNGNWGKPINLGETINTPYAERTPFLHPDMKTLYFSSDGHGGLGRLDVFKTTRLDDSWTNWSKPINLGKEINTAASDWGYKISTQGKTAYFAIKNEDESGTSSQDICTIELPQELRPGKVSTISGILTDSDGNPIAANIVWEDLETGEVVGQLKSDPNTGKFFIALPNDRKYSYFVNKEGFFPKANNIDLRNKGETLEVNESLEMVRIEEMIEKDIALPLKNLFFETNKYDIQSTSFPELKRLVKLVKDYDLIVEISGHTDNKGSDNDNMLLSQNRADAVKDYLIKQGCNAERIKAIGYGEERPIRSNDSAIGRAQNRRVEVRFKRD